MNYAHIAKYGLGTELRVGAGCPGASTIILQPT